jgi:hypothetical protein
LKGFDNRESSKLGLDRNDGMILFFCEEIAVTRNFSASHLLGMRFLSSLFLFCLGDNLGINFGDEQPYSFVPITIFPAYEGSTLTTVWDSFEACVVASV